MHEMEVVEWSDFQRSWLQERLDPEEYFFRQTQTRQALRGECVRNTIEHNRRLVMEVWVVGEELWSWRYHIDGGISGAYGLALLREGEIIRIWFVASIL